MKKRVLVVDDDPSIRESLTEVLEESGYEVVSASDGAEVESKFDGQTFDLLLLDLNMPQRDGWDVLGHTSANHPLLPVIMITGMSDQLDTTIIPGVDALLKKPIEVPLLLRTVESVLAESPEARLRRLSERMAADETAAPGPFPDVMGKTAAWSQPFKVR